VLNHIRYSSDIEGDRRHATRARFNDYRRKPFSLCLRGKHEHIHRLKPRRGVFLCAWQSEHIGNSFLLDGSLYSGAGIPIAYQQKVGIRRLSVNAACCFHEQFEILTGSEV